MRILCVGMMVCDVLIAPVPDDILQRDSAAIQRPVTACGGDALNVALGLAKLGQDVALVGRIADDANGDFIRAECSRVGVYTGGLVVDDTCATATTFVLIDTHGERHFLTDKAIFAKLIPADVRDDQIENADIVYFGSAMAMLGMDGAGIADLFRRTKDAGKLTAMDTALDEDRPRADWMSELAPALALTDLFFPSLDEARLITGKEEPGDIAACFRPFGMKAFGVKLGGRGCYVTDFNRDAHLPCLPSMPVVDTTGAGDSFFAGLLCGQAHGWDVFRSAGFANTVAALNVGAVGGTAGIPNFEKADAVFQDWAKQINLFKGDR